MEIKLPSEGRALLGRHAVENASPERTAARTDHSVRVLEANVDTDLAEREKSDLRELMKRTSELVSINSRNLKFEVIEDAGLVQIQVIDTTDGRIVRKIPSDEVLKLVTHIREKLSEQVDVTA